eukprot:gene12001-16068_t
MKPSTSLQRIFAKLAILTATLAVLFIIVWMSGTNYDESYLGGLNWKELIFNWHPILMVGGLIFCSVNALVSYRILPFTHIFNKSVHVMWHTAGVVCFSTGLAAVVIGNNYPNYNQEGSYYSNLNSLHSFLGLTAIILYGQNYCLGFLFFLVPNISEKFKIIYKSNHIFLGLFALIAAALAAETGIMELTTELGCGYTITAGAGNDTHVVPDINPASHYHLLTTGCKVANGAGVFILLTVFFALYSLIDIGEVENQAKQDDSAIFDESLEQKTPLKQNLLKYQA